MSGDKPADLDAMRRERDHWWKRECLWFRQYVRAGIKYRHARDECRRLSRIIWAAEAAQGQRIVTEDDGEAT